jgi:flagellar biosynthesis chaperone FliJ
MALISSKICTTVQAEIKKLKSIIKTLKEDAKLYSRNHDAEIKELEASIGNYEAFLATLNKELDR